MTILYDIARFCDAFEEQVSAIEHLKSESIPEKDICHIQLYKKSLVMSAIDTLAGLRLPGKTTGSLTSRIKNVL